MEDPKSKGKSMLHWENKRAREVLQTQHGLLLAELIREYLEFYKLDYSKQIFLPETNLNTKQASSKEELADKTGLGSLDEKKPLLLQMLEQFSQGGGAQRMAGLAKESDNSSPNAAPGVQFSEEKASRVIQPLSIGEGILSKERSPPVASNTTDKHLEKANSLLDELSREEKSGFKAELGLVPESSTERLPGDAAKAAPVKRTTSDIDDNYDGDDFDDIDEDLPDNDIDGSGSNIRMPGIGDTHGITVS